MAAENHDTLTTARAWLQAGHAGVLMTVAATWGSSPRPVGAMMCVRDDGLVAGSVSGGCVEDDLIERIRHDGVPSYIGTVVYGVSKDEAARFGLPCGGNCAWWWSRWFSR